MAVFPQPSVAIYTRVVVSKQPTKFTMSLTNVTTGVPQASDAETEEMFGIGTVALHPKGKLAGHVIVGGVISTVRVMICVHVALLPHASVALYVLVVVSTHPAVLTASLTNVIVTAPQASVADTELISAPGTVALHPGKFSGAGQVITGGVVSTVRIIS